MNSHVKKLTIKKLFGNKDVTWNLKDVNVLVGKNGLGKSTILQLIQTTLTQEPNDSLTLCDRVDIEFQDGNTTFSSSKIEIDENLFKESFQKFIESESFETQLISNLFKNKKISKKEKELIKNKIISTIIDNKNSEIKVKQFQYKEHEEIFHVEFISTINMSANSINKIQTSDGRIANFLDLEIQSELNRLIKDDTGDLQNKLINSLNKIFNETNKKVDIIKNKLIIKISDGRTIAYKNLSSGERQVIYIFLKVINANINNSIILMDEPEISLHLSWQENLLTSIREVNSNSQIIIVTHSPAIVMNGWIDSFIDIKDIFIEN